jgi:PAS domain S-box-containing protein
VTAGISVLHVDDDPEFAEVAAAFLGREGVDVTSVAGVDEALARLARDPFDCVVSDYDMPDEDGLAFLERVRDRDPEMPFVLFTGKGSEEIASEAISKGVTDYLQKEGRSETYAILANRIENAVERRRARAEADRTRRFLEKVVERATDIIATVDTRGEVVFVSQSVEEILGYTPEEVRERGAFGFVHPDDRETVRRRFEARLDDPDLPTGIRHRVVRADGSVVEVEGRAYNLVDDPDVEGILIYARPTADAADPAE